MSFFAATFYATGLGACGITNTDTDFIAAVSHTFFDSYHGYNGANPNNNPLCGRKVTANCTFSLLSLPYISSHTSQFLLDKGKKVTVAITDRCEGCAEFDLDFSPKAFTKLADQSLGRLKGMTWSFVKN